jgi:hypothetical protein
MDQNDLRRQEEDKGMYDATFQAAMHSEDNKVPVSDQDYSQFITPAAIRLKMLFNEYKADRRELEDRWLADLRQFRGEYDPETLAKFHPKRSKAFLSITRTKVATVSARMTDLLFPANGEKNWGIDPTPTPEMNPAIIQDLIAQYTAQTGQEATEEFIRQELNKVARQRAEAMERDMADQLTELKYRLTIREIIKDGNMYGTGILKGPLVKRQIVKRWLPKGDEWATVTMDRYSPWCEHISPWDFYPDMSARTMENVRGVFQRHVMSRHKVAQLARRPDFNKDAIVSYIKVVKDGDAPYENWEQGLQQMNRSGSIVAGYKDTSSAGTSYIGTGQGPARRRGKYEVLEFWGYMSSDDLKELDIEIDEEELGVEVVVNLWILGNMVIKAVVSNIDGIEIPYHLYYYEKDDTSIFGEGIPTIMRDAQKLFNSAVRAMLDNAAISAGPIIEANADLLDPSEDPRDLYPFRVFVRDGMGMEASAPALRVFSLPSYTADFMNMIQFFNQAADDITTVPRFMYGDSNQVKGAGKTATGLSMLMGAANVTLKEQIKNFDDGITKPFIKSLYHWNMEFNPKEHVKGDFGIHAKGSTSLIAREVRMESLMQFLNSTNNEIDMQYINRSNVLREMTKAMELDDLDLLKDSNTIKMEEESRSKAMEEDKNFEKELAMLKAKSGGHMSPAARGTGARPTMEQLTSEQLVGGQIPEAMSREGEPINPS